MLKRKWLWSIPIGIGFIAVVVGSFYDLEISKSIISSGNVFGYIMAALGEYPFYASLAFLAGVLWYASWRRYKDNLGLKILFSFLSVVAICFGIYYQGNAMFNINGFGGLNRDVLGKFYLSLPLGTLIITPWFIPGYLLAKKAEHPENLVFITLFALLTMGFACGFVNIIKPLFHRPRFRWMLDRGNNFGEFHNWWEPLDSQSYDAYLSSAIANGLGKEEFKSFPSGHVASCACGLITIAYLPLLFPKLQKHQTWMFLAFLSFTVLLAFTRILVGAHFLSDVGMGLLIASVFGFVLDLLMTKLLIEKKNN